MPAPVTPARFLDPAQDLSQFEQSIIDQVSKQPAPKRDRLAPYMEKAKAGMDSMAILKESFAQKEQQLIEAAASAMAPAPVQASPFDMAMGHGLDRPTASPDAAMASAGPAPTGGPPATSPQTGPAQVEVPQVDETAYKDALRKFNLVMESRPVMGEIPELKQPGIEALGLALLFSALDQQNAADYFAIPFQSQIQQRQENIKRIVQKYELDQNDWKTAAGLAKQVLDMEHDSLSDSYKLRSDAQQFNTREQNDYTVAVRGQDLALQKSQEGIASREKIAAEKSASDEKKALLRQVVSKNPEARVAAATLLRNKYGLDAYDPELMAKLTPDEQVSYQRAQQIEAMIPINVEIGKQKVALSDAQRRWIETKIEHYPEFIAMDMARIAQGWARVKVAEDSFRYRQDEQSQNDHEQALKTQRSLLKEKLERAKDLYGPGHFIVQALQQQYDELGSQLLDLQEGYAPATVEPGGTIEYPGVGQVTSTPSKKVAGLSSGLRRDRKTKASIDLGPFGEVA